MARVAEEVMLNVANVHLHQKLSEAARQVAENVKMIKLAVKRVPPGALGKYCPFPSPGHPTLPLSFYFNMVEFQLINDHRFTIYLEPFQLVDL